MEGAYRFRVHVGAKSVCGGPTCQVSASYVNKRDVQQGPRPRSKSGSSLRLSQAPVLQAPVQIVGTRIANFRFWHDEKRFRGSGDVSLAQHMLFAAGGIRTGGNFKAAPVQGPMGWQQPDRWDILWSTSDGNHKAAHVVTAGQLISALPGLESITKKRHLAITLHAAYGETAWQIVPRTYSIPAQLLQWRQRLADEAAAAAAKGAGPSEASRPTASSGAAGGAAGGDVSTRIRSDVPMDVELSSGFWVLKTGAHLGQGLQIVPANKAISTLLDRNKPFLNPPRLAEAQHAETRNISSSTDKGDLHISNSDSHNSDSSNGGRIDQNRAVANVDRPVICVQQYITNPLLIHGRKFGLRLWALVIGPSPFRAYLYNNGLVLFSSEQYNADMEEVQSGLAGMQSHLTNHAQNQSADVWPLQRLYDMLGPQKSAELWAQLSSTAGRVVAAAGRHVRAAAEELQLPQECAFELLGLDFLLDGSLRPWLLEVNASPSMAWQHDDPQTARMIKEVKQELLSDLFSLLRLQERYPVTEQQPEPQQGLQQQQASPHGHNKPQELRLQQEGVAAGKQQLAAAVCQQQPAAGLHQHSRSLDSIRPHSSKPLLAGDAELNQLLIRAASDKYFKSRPELGQLVQEAAQLLQGAVAAAASRQQAKESMQHIPEQLKQPLTSTVPTDSSQPDVMQLLRDTGERLMQFEAEWQSRGRWQCLLDHMPADVAGCAQQCDLGAAMRL